VEPNFSSIKKGPCKTRAFSNFYRLFRLFLREKSLKDHCFSAKGVLKELFRFP